MVESPHELLVYAMKADGVTRAALSTKLEIDGLDDEPHIIAILHLLLGTAVHVKTTRQMRAPIGEEPEKPISPTLCVCVCVCVLCVLCVCVLSLRVCPPFSLPHAFRRGVSNSRLVSRS